MQNGPVIFSVALLTVAACTHNNIARNAPATPQPRAAISNQPPISGPGYQAENIVQAFEIGNRRGHDPTRPQTRGHLQNADTNGGNTNYLLSIPVLNLPGRGLNVALTLYYNSQVWTKYYVGGKYYMTFNHDADWPAPGWLLSFGSVIQAGSGGWVLQDSDGTLHPFGGQISEGGSGNVVSSFTGHTTDGSLVDYTSAFLQEPGTNNIVLVGNAKWPNGKTVTYGPCAMRKSKSTCYATKITDVNGNFISISYVSNTNPQIQSVRDTLGRVIAFNYDANNHFIAITAPGLNGSTRTVARLHYSHQVLVNNQSYRFPLYFQVPGVVITDAVDGIYFPATSTGYWFGDSDSYSSYGMIAKISQNRGMALTGASPTNQGILTAGSMSLQRTYHWLTGQPPLMGPPQYDAMQQIWTNGDGTASPPAITHYAVNSDGNPRTAETAYPYGTKVSEFRYNDPGKFDDNLTYRQITYDGAGNRLKQIDTTWEQGDYNSPVVKSVNVTDQLGQVTSTVYDYARDVNGFDEPATNQIADIKQLDYNGKVLRASYYNNLTDPGYGPNGSHVFNLPSSIFVQDSNNTILTRTDYAYDQQAPASVAGAVGYLDPGTQYRGNVTHITRYKNLYPNWAGITEIHGYDTSGNLITVSGPCCVNTAFTYSAATQFAYPDKITQGSSDPSAQLTKSFTYDFGTGQVLTSTDSNHLSTAITYDAALRPTNISLPTSAYIQYQYDDAAMSVSQTAIYARQKIGIIAFQSNTVFNGLGLITQVGSAAPDDHTWNSVSEQYDVLGRLSKRSQPFVAPQKPALWTTFGYDSLGRVTAIQNPDGSKQLTCFNEPDRPASASNEPGQTVRNIFNIPASAPVSCGNLGSVVGLRERWSRMNAFGELAEVVEPDPNGGGTFSASPTNIDTDYTYSPLGLLIQVLEGPAQQERDFQYDPLGRLTAEYLPEKSRSLDGNGKYVGANGQWSDVFSYDDHSNLISYWDARGVKTAYNFANDPLNRLQGVSYDTPAVPNVDLSSPVLSTYPIFYGYTTAGDVTRVSSVTRPSGINQWWERDQYGYDSQGRLSSKILLFSGQSPLVLSYKYDNFNRVTEEVYPVEYGTPAQAQKTVDFSYGFGGSLTELKVDGADYASQFAYNPAFQAASIAVGPPGAHQTLETYNYDSATGLMTSQKVQRAGSPLLNLAYQYLPSGQLSQTSEGSETTNYVYDTLGRLHEAKATAWSETYAFDSYGNRTSVTANGKAPDGSPMPADGFPALNYDQKTNHITTPGFGYDAAGNQTHTIRPDGSGLTYRYDQANRLAEVVDSNKKPIEEYLYDSLGRRLQVTSPTGAKTFYVWDGSHVISEYTQPNSNKNWSWYKDRVYLGSRILASITAGEQNQLVYYHHPDRLGTRLITNSFDSSKIEQATLPFGTLLPIGSADPINPVFTSYERDVTTGLDYAENRFYDPKQRFTQVDPMGTAAVNQANPQTLNLYSYVANDPVNRLDPTGLDETITCTQIGEGYSQCTSSNSPYSSSIYDPNGNLVTSGLTESATVVGDLSQLSMPTVGTGASTANLEVGQLACDLCTNGFSGETSAVNRSTSVSATGVWTFGGQFGLNALIYAGTFGAGVYFDTDYYGFGLYTSVAEGLSVGSSASLNLELGSYKNLDVLNGLSWQLSGTGGYETTFGLNSYWGTEAQEFRGLALDVGTGGGMSLSGSISNTMLYPIVDPFHSSFDPFYPLGNAPFFGGP